MTPERRARLRARALETLHKSCPTTPRAEYIEPGAARSIALGYLELSLMPTGVWRAWSTDDEVADVAEAVTLP